MQGLAIHDDPVHIKKNSFQDVSVLDKNTDLRTNKSIFLGVLEIAVFNEVK